MLPAIALGRGTTNAPTFSADSPTSSATMTPTKTIAGGSQSPPRPSRRIDRTDGVRTLTVRSRAAHA